MSFVVTNVLLQETREKKVGPGDLTILDLKDVHKLLFGENPTHCGISWALTSVSKLQITSRTTGSMLCEQTSRVM